MNDIFWRDLPKGARVEDTGPSYVAILPDDSRHVITWNGNDQAQAMGFLRAMAGGRGVQRLKAAKRPVMLAVDKDRELPIFNYGNISLEEN